MKQKIAKSFHQRAHEYDVFAQLQIACAAALDEKFAVFYDDDAATSGQPLAHIVELGCGTGALTQQLANRYPYADFLACDIAPAMVNAVSLRMQQSIPAISLTTLETDAEYLHLAVQADLIASNLCVQWFDDQCTALLHHMQQTRYLAWTTLLSGTFAEWLRAHEILGLQPGLRRFLHPDELLAAATTLPSKRLHFSVEHRRINYPSALGFLHALRGVGATTPHHDHRPAPLQPLLRHFADGFTADYVVGYLLIEVA